MKTGDKVYIHFHDIEACGYGNSINCNGTIVGKANGEFLVEFDDGSYNFGVLRRKYFYENDLTLLPE